MLTKSLCISTVSSRLRLSRTAKQVLRRNGNHRVSKIKHWQHEKKQQFCSFFWLLRIVAFGKQPQNTDVSWSQLDRLGLRQPAARTKFISYGSPYVLRSHIISCHLRGWPPSRVPLSFPASNSRRKHTPCESRIDWVTTNDFRPAQEASVPLRCRVRRLLAEYERNGYEDSKRCLSMGGGGKKFWAFRSGACQKAELHDSTRFYCEDLWRSMKIYEDLCRSMKIYEDLWNSWT